METKESIPIYIGLDRVVSDPSLFDVFCTDIAQGFFDSDWFRYSTDKVSFNLGSRDTEILPEFERKIKEKVVRLMTRRNRLTKRKNFYPKVEYHLFDLTDYRLLTQFRCGLNGEAVYSVPLEGVLPYFLNLRGRF